jgi:dTDP-4-dehydrorhamnose reductase
MRITVIGAAGQVGTDIVDAARRAGCDVVTVNRAECDVTDKAAVHATLRSLEPGDAVVNTAAYHRTDDCELRPDLALAVNAVGAQHVADAAREHGASVAFLSSDYVFDGAKRSPYLESDVPRPINAYGVSKLAGEMLVEQSNSGAYVVRVSSVFGVAGSSGKGGNFVETMIAKARRGERIEVVDDIVMAPTYSADAAGLLVSLLMRRAPFGIYHLANAGSCSWHAFAQAILEAAGSEVRPVAVGSAAMPTRARRPSYSVLASERLGELGLHARGWREALCAYLAAKGHTADAAAGGRSRGGR